MRSKKKLLVIDADVARAAGGEKATAIVSVNCTHFLQTFQNDTTHHIVMTTKLSKEWEKHQSNYTTAWLANMIATKRFHVIKLSDNQLLYNKIFVLSNPESEINEMLKDIHLLEIALITDKTIISLDETVRKLFAKASNQVGEIKSIIWVNPVKIESEQAIDWLKAGAPFESHRQLSEYQKE